ncbi:MAG: zf-TFIIB domain-containing protein [Thermoplasmatota archaeon]
MKKRNSDNEMCIIAHRICPRCDEDMCIEERGGEKLEVCTQCGGIWFDPHELDELLGEDISIELLINIKKPIKGENLKCPSCREYMETKDIFGVQVDECRTCKGIWLDSGETQKIWEEKERTLDPYELDPDHEDGENIWNRFRVKYYGFERLTED